MVGILGGAPTVVGILHAAAVDIHAPTVVGVLHAFPPNGGALPPHGGEALPPNRKDALRSGTMWRWRAPPPSA